MAINIGIPNLVLFTLAGLLLLILSRRRTSLAPYSPVQRNRALQWAGWLVLALVAITLVEPIVKSAVYGYQHGRESRKPYAAATR